MGWCCVHVPEGKIVLRLSEHGGEKEKRHQRLCEKMVAELDAAIKAIAEKLEYAEIILYTDFD
jgi:hypothetical protein